MNRRLHGSCEVPVAAHATRQGGQLALVGLVGDAGSGQLLRAAAEGPYTDPGLLGERVAAMLIAEGAEALLRRA
jgi:hydroxymethylbilane synthase